MAVRKGCAYTAAVSGEEPETTETNARKSKTSERPDSGGVDDKDGKAPARASGEGAPRAEDDATGKKDGAKKTGKNRICHPAQASAQARQRHSVDREEREALFDLHTDG